MKIIITCNKKSLSLINEPVSLINKVQIAYKTKDIVHWTPFSMPSVCIKKGKTTEASKGAAV